MSRKAAVKRKTNEVEVMIDLNIDGKGIYEINTGIPFFDHMLEQLSKHGFFDLRIIANGDTEIDFHHTVEDVGICLGEAFESALGDKKSIKRYGHFSVPFDETLSSSTMLVGSGSIELLSAASSLSRGLRREVISRIVRSVSSSWEISRSLWC